MDGMTDGLCSEVRTGKIFGGFAFVKNKDVVLILTLKWAIPL